jgi:hypothetical protein
MRCFPTSVLVAVACALGSQGCLSRKATFSLSPFVLAGTVIHMVLYHYCVCVIGLHAAVVHPLDVLLAWLEVRTEDQAQ